LIRISKKKLKHIRKTLILAIASESEYAANKGICKEVSNSFMLLSVYSRGLNTYYASDEGSVGPRTIGTRGNKNEIPAPDVIPASSQSL
jgi:hypothetical protein